MGKILVVPDVHGRDFWEPAMEYGGQVVFLGDYHDPYPFGFTPDGRRDLSAGVRESMSLYNFTQILAFARANPGRVQLLLGNHDVAYILPGYSASRMDYGNAPQLRMLFAENADLFRGCVRHGNVLFSHAGVSQQWYDALLAAGEADPAKSVEENVDAAIMRMAPLALAVGPERGGCDPCAGPLWMDVAELADGRATPVQGIAHQVFGHTQVRFTGRAIDGPGWTLVDSRALFEVDTATGAVELLSC